jgi:hypothetical protein
LWLGKLSHCEANKRERERERERESRIGDDFMLKICGENEGK